VTVIYSDEVIPASFTAELDGVDISDSFNPAPGNSEIVDIALQQGRNVLILSIDGDLAGKVSNDKDRMVFKVE
jgi:hypothetical protein